jgi:signal transduction histidine kinase
LDATQAIRTIARSSLAEVRRVLFGLRGESSGVELAPLPTLGDVTALISATAGAGLDVRYHCDEEAAHRVSATVGAGAYRIVQESLTNVLKHAGPNPAVSVDIRLVDGELRIDVGDDGRGAAPTSRHRGVSGIAGMTERAEVLGGRLEAGPAPGGGFRVSAVLPSEPGAGATGDPA